MRDELNEIYRFALSDDWKWARAIARVESGENLYAVGDGSLARGLYQMHADFMADYWSEYDIDDAAHGDVWIQSVCLRRFWFRQSNRSVNERLSIFHYGLSRHKLLAGSDPDDYISRIRAAFD